MSNIHKIYFNLVIIVLVGISAGCGRSKPALKVFEPPNDSPFRITFSYPAEWEWKTKQGLSPSEQGVMTTIIKQSPNNEPVWAFFDVYVSSSPETEMLHYIDVFLETKRTLPYFDILEDKVMQINSHSLRWFITRSTSVNGTGPSRPYIGDDIFLLSGDRHYRIGLRYPEDETDRTFYKEFQDMIASIRFLP
jgi:hypothetical protein